MERVPRIIKKIFVYLFAAPFMGLLFLCPNFNAVSAQTESVSLIREDCTGYTNCYTSLADWEANYGNINFGGCSTGDLVCADKIAVAKIEGAWTNPDTNPLSIAGWNTGPNNYIKIYTTSEARHSGVWNNNAYRIQISTGIAIDNEENYVKIDGLQIKVTSNSSSGYGVLSEGINGGGDVEISNNIIVGPNIVSGPGYDGVGIFMYSNDSDTTHKIWNNIIYNWGSGDSVYGILLWYTNDIAYIYNNTIYNSTLGISADGGNATLKNNISIADFPSTGFYSLENFNIASSTSNASNNGDIPGLNPIILSSGSPNDYFISSTEFHINPTAQYAQEITDAGENLSTDANLAFQNDAGGEIRGAVWDIGADEKDTTPPKRSNGSPQGTIYLVPGPTNKIITLNTDKNATCKYSTSPGINYNSMANIFSATGGTFHSTIVYNLNQGETYSYYVKCQDVLGNANTDDYIINFSVSPIPIGGLWGNYNKLGTDDWTEFKTAKVENIDFLNFDATLLSRIGQINDAEIIWRGAILADTSGTYNFRIDTLGQYSRFDIDDTYLWPRGGWWAYGDKSNSIYLTAGWHFFYLRFQVPSYQSDSQAQLYWTPPGQSEEIIPTDHLSPQLWSNKIITIPDISKPKEQINYITAGVGTADLPNPTIEITLPNNVLKDEVWIIWLNSQNPNITVTNTLSGVSESIVGTRLTTVQGLGLDGVVAKLPQTLIPDSGTLELSFSEQFPSRPAGIGIIVPYVDPSRPLGRISINAMANSIYRRVSPVFIFPVNLEVSNNIQPLFMFSDGETKVTAPGSYRPNYLVMLAGKGAQPSQFDILQNMGGTKIVPQDLSVPIDLNNSNTWYPSFGREGPQFDVVSPNYVPNQWSGAADTGGGQINSISIPLDSAWVAFQIYSSNFDEDGVWGDAESGTSIVGGIFSTLALAKESVPDAPANLTATAGSGTDCETINLNWTDNSTNEIKFEIERKNDGGTFAWIADAPADATSYLDSNLIGGNDYSYRARACNNDNCSSYSNETASTTAINCSDFNLSNSNAIYSTIVNGLDSVSTETAISAINVVNFSDSINLSVDSISPAIQGATYNFNGITCSIGEICDTLTSSEYATGSVFSVNVPGDTNKGLYTITIKGEGGGLIRTTKVNLNIEILEPNWREF